MGQVYPWWSLPQYQRNISMDKFTQHSDRCSDSGFAVSGDAAPSHLKELKIEPAVAFLTGSM